MNKTRISSLNLSINLIADYIRDEIRTWPEVKAVYTSEELIEDNGANNTWKTMIQNGYDFERSGEIIFTLEPGYLLKSSDTRAHIREPLADHLLVMIHMYLYFGMGKILLKEMCLLLIK